MCNGGVFRPAHHRAQDAQQGLKARQSWFYMRKVLAPVPAGRIAGSKNRSVGGMCGRAWAAGRALGANKPQAGYSELLVEWHCMLLAMGTTITRRAKTPPVDRTRLLPLIN